MKSVLICQNLNCVNLKTIYGDIGSYL